MNKDKMQAIADELAKDIKTPLHRYLVQSIPYILFRYMPMSMIEN